MKSSTLTGKRIAFATSRETPLLTESDLLAAGVLRSQGANVVPALWDDSDVAWGRFEMIIIRSTWDYHRHADRFSSWLDDLERTRVPLWNPLPVLRWNMNKRYLGELAGKGIPIPKTYFSPESEPFSLEPVRNVLGTDDVVGKPIVSASAWETRHFNLKTLSKEDNDWLKALAVGPGVLIQEFLPEIVSEGEWSLIFFGTTYSHAVRKRPADGDFRVQEEMGGTYVADTPEPAIVRQAERIVASVAEPLLYARVDGVIRSGTFILIELELLEPALFFDVKTESSSLFCRRVAELA